MSNDKFNNKGYLGKNKYKKSDNHPEYKGKATIDGVEKEIAAWIQEKNGEKFFSLKFQEKYNPHNKVAPSQEQQPDNSLDDISRDIPF